ncbi:hypothetical protein Sya03_04590 [Spirilliplanes yamanashiensis]|uniref:Beta-lactamase-related domain-containing protein n=1 Tax=Spirilliplanes yamanashiensis TaxID=42233 RepID=A0A8J4DG28_9ACTN|nr:hypothetical protein Sya03_04590 [Spirilliplanes yamanashiensis]
MALAVRGGGEVAGRAVVGHALRYAAGPRELPAAQRVPMRADSVFDLASLTKVYTAILVLQLVDAGRVELDAPVAAYLKGFGKRAVTVRMLLTHTAGLPVGTGSRPATAVPLLPGAVPGTTFRYSSVGPMVLAQLVEKVTGRPLDAALRDDVTGPLGLTGTGFRPLTWVGDRDRLVATDARRGLLRGTVHDDVCRRLGGVAGHAGVFGTAADVAAIGRLLLGGGALDGTRLLSAPIVREMLTDQNAGKPAVDPDRPGRTAAHGLGVVLDQPWFMGRLAAPGTFGHTGFTGTSLLVDPARDLVLVLLTNRAHPDWTWSDPDVHRVAVADLFA